jgi:DNA-binding NtrC family response regulator
LTFNNRETNLRIVGSSAAVAELRERIATIAPLPFAVLIQGEPGTGKELIAQEIHRQSGRNPLITVDCTGLTGELFTSELFGHDRGAFTGAVAERVGLVEAAGAGTVFLDEIGELDLNVQSRLLRFLQEKEFRRLGSNRVRTASCRIIAATNRNLANAVREGTFRADLYERLRVIEVSSPPLRARDNDIRTLVAHFAKKHGLQVNLSDEALHRMSKYSWPGNIRELEHLVIRVGAMWAGRTVSEHDLPSLWEIDSFQQNLTTLSDVVQPKHVPDTLDTRWEGSALEDVEMRRIMEVVRETNGHLTRAAVILGIGRTTLYRRLQKLREHGDVPLTHAAGA